MIKSSEPMMKFSILAMVLMLLIISSCSGPRQLNISILGDEAMNNKNVVVVCIYQLKNDTDFQRASVESFWQDDVKALENDLVDRIEITLAPKETKEFFIELKKETKFIGAAADFKEPDKKGWRQILPIASKTKEIYVIVGYNSIVIQEL